jgi:hypothetical protein
MPLAGGAFVAAGVSWLAGDLAENVVLSGSLLAGLASLVPSYSRLHRRPYCLALFVIGLFIILAARMLAASESAEIAGVVTAAVFLVTAHLVNMKLCRSCSACNPGNFRRSQDDSC